MSRDIRDKLMVGLHYSDMESWLKEKCDSDDVFGNIYEVIEYYFDYMSPAYDSPKEEWFIGFHIMNEVPLKELVENVKEASEKFEKITGITPVVKGGAHVF